MRDIDFPWPITVKAQGVINGEELRVSGAGVVRTLGVYDAILNFDRIPSNFHPSAIASAVVSNCCGAGASARNGGKNMTSMGVQRYAVHRILGFENGNVTMRGRALYSAEALILDIDVEGTVEMPDDLIGHSIYQKKVSPSECQTKVFGVGEGSVFRSNGGELPFTINTVYEIEPSPLPNPLTQDEFRIATEDGVLNGRSYALRIHSIFDGLNTMNKVATQLSVFQVDA